MIASLLKGFQEELKHASAEGRSVEVWWRDDDAVRAGPALERLLRLSAEVGAPLAIAASPALVEPSLPERVAGEADVVTLVHGFRHANHAPAGERSAEYGSHRSLATLTAELRGALACAQRLFGAQAAPIFVPPWNRIAPALPAMLPDLGYRALSAFSTGPDDAADGCARLHTHLDPVDWRGGRSLLDEPILLRQWRRALSAPAGPVGLLTHHLAFDETLWSFARELLGLLADHPAVRLRSAPSLLAAAEPSSAPALTGSICGRGRLLPELVA